MEKLKTATGKEFDCDYLAVLPMPAQAYIRILGTPITTVAAVFSDPEETLELRYCEHCLENYTRIVALIPEGDAIKVALAKD